MSNPNLDRRIQKTLQLLQNALSELVAEKEYSDITIQDILDRANVGRSTFYSHFENKDHLLRSLLSRLQEEFDEGIEQITSGEKTLVENSHNMPLNVLQLVEQHHRLFKAMLVHQASDMQNNPFYEYLLLLTREHVALMVQDKTADEKALKLASHYYASAFIGALTWWLENDMVYSPEHFATILNRFALSGLLDAFEAPA